MAWKTDMMHIVVQLLIGIVPPIVSAFVAWKVSELFGKHLSKRQEREHILRQVLISRAEIELHEYVRTLSYIELAFSRDKAVLDAWRVLNRAYNTYGVADVYLDEKRDVLIREMAKALGYGDDTVSQLLGHQAYKPRWLANEIKAHRIEVARVVKQWEDEQRAAGIDPNIIAMGPQ